MYEVSESQFIEYWLGQPMASVYEMSIVYNTDMESLLDNFLEFWLWYYARN
jgi:hypothetical protein